MARKSFQSASPRALEEFDINGEVFHFNPNLPGQVLVEFMAEMESDDPSSLAKVVTRLFEAAIVPDDQERFFAFTRSVENNVSLEMLSEICGYIAEASSGNAAQRVPSGVG